MFQKYADYTVEDFVKDEHFIDWVKLCHPEDVSIWQSVAEDYPYQAETIMHARQIILDLDEASRINGDKLDAEEIWQEIEVAISTESARINRVFGFNRFHYAAAASLIFLLSLVWWKYDYSGRKPETLYSKLIQEAEIPVQEAVNNSKAPLLVRLPDGSTVTLEENSRLSYSKDFSRPEREVFLSGGAFFEVAKNPKKPFVVYANELVTKVLGTSFMIRAFEKDQRVIVAVKTGKVSVFTNKENTPQNSKVKSITLIPNQQAIFSRKEERLSRSLVEQPQVIISKQELLHFSFTNAPVVTIFEALEKAYGVKMQFDEEVLSGCRLTTSLSNETLFERLDVICEAIDATYKVVDGEVLISGKKCS
jgi:transmembrane sensor